VSGDELHSFPHKHIVKCIEFSDDGSQLLTGSNEKLLRIYDLNNPDAGQQTQHLMAVHYLLRCIGFVHVIIKKRRMIGLRLSVANLEIG